MNCLKSIIFSFLLLCAGLLFSQQQNYDSLMVVAEKTELKKDFEAIDSILEINGSKYIPQKKLIVLCALRTKELNYEFLHAKFKLRESVIQTISGDSGSAMEMAQEALAIFSKYNSINILSCYNTMGSMIASNGDHEMGLNYLKKALKATENFKSNRKYHLHKANNNLVIAYIYILMEDYAKAKTHLNTALSLSQEFEYVTIQSYVLLNYMTIALKEGKYEEALNLGQQSIAFTKQQNLITHTPISYSKTGDIYFEMDNLSAALTYYLDAEKFAKQENLNGRLISIYEKIIAIYRKQKLFNKASDYQSKNYSLFKELKEQERNEQLEMHQISFEVTEKNRQINELATKQRIVKDRNSYLRTVIYVTFGTGALLALIIFLLFNRYRLIKKMQHERAKKALSAVQLSALKSQMNPHFIFNSLNSIQALILNEESELSYLYVSKFAQLMRSILSHSGKELIPFSEEIAALELYLELECLRFENSIDLKLETNGVDDIEIPPLLIQPFIENAFKHGLLHKKGQKKLTVKFELDQVLICTITDNGIGREASKKINLRQRKLHTSFAIESIQDRLLILKQLHGNDLGFEYFDINTEGNTGTIVKLHIPFKRKF